MPKFIAIAIVLAMLISSEARADVTIDIDGRWHVDGAIHVSYMIAGGSSVRGGRAPATGGAAFIPTARLFFARRFFDPYVAVAPLIVAPNSFASVGVVAAHDLGLSWHPDSRAWSIGTAATIAPSYMRFCNVEWCLRQFTAMYGGELHLTGEVLHTERGGMLRWDASVRMLTGRPKAWTWGALSAEEQKLNRLSWVIGGGGSWTF